MKEIILKKLIITIETTNNKNIPGDVMNIIYALEKATMSNEELKLSFALNENKNTDTINTNTSSDISPDQ